jgi:hypothetical protein
MARLSNGWGYVLFIGYLVVPGLIAGYFLHSSSWILLGPLYMAGLMLVIAALPFWRKVTPQAWADELEKHLLGTEGPYDWDDATSVRLADKRLENLRRRLTPDFDMLETPEKREEFRQIIEALRHGEIP